MRTPSNKLKTILWAVAFAVFMPGPVYAFDHDLTDNTTTTKAYLTANPCRKQSFKDVPWGVFLEPQGAFKGLWELAFAVEVMGVDDLSGTFIEAKPDKRLTMGLDNADYIKLNNYVADTLALSCGGTLLGALEITSFDGTLSHSSFDGTRTRVKDRITIKFRSKFTWVDLGGKMRTGHLDFQSRFDGLHLPPELPWTFPKFP
jgi:hypothetical protein